MFTLLAIVSVSFPFFALIAAGYVATRTSWLPTAAIPGLNGFVLYFALPCMLFRFGASLHFREVFQPALLLAYSASALFVLALTLALCVNSRVSLKDASFAGLVAAFPNSGFMGIPLITALFGVNATGPVMATLLVDLFLTTSVAIAIAHHSPTEEAGLSNALKSFVAAIKNAAKNPLPWAIGLGFLASAFSVRLAGPVDQVMRMFADAASPVALFTIGAVLARKAQMPSEGQASQERIGLSDVAVPAVLKLVVHPLALLFALAIARILGAEISPLTLSVLLCIAALPSASNVSLLTERFGANTAYVAKIILTTTVISFASFSCIAWLAGAKP